MWIAEASDGRWQATTEFKVVEDVELWTEGFRLTTSVCPASKRLIARFGKDAIMVMAAEVEDAKPLQVGDAALHRLTCRFVSRLPRTVGIVESPADSK